MTQITKICLLVLSLGVVAHSLNLIDVYHKGVFNNAVLKNRKPVVVYFTSGSCNICNIVYSKLENFAQENYKTVYVAKVDFDKVPQLKEEFGIDKVPTTRAYVNGKVVNEVRGPVWPLVEKLANGVLN